MRFIDCGVVGSTFDVAREIAKANDFGPLWVRADAQTSGRGRRGRTWQSPEGNLFCTGLYPHAMTPADVGRLSFVASLAVFDVMKTFIEDDIVTLKWPNDVLIDGAKAAGILLENGHTEGQSWVMVGIGINLVSHPSGLDYPATSVLAHMRADSLTAAEPAMTGPQAALVILSQRFDHWFNLYTAQGFAPIREAWRARATGVPGPVRVRLSKESFTGQAVDLGGEGELQVSLPNGTIRDVHAGDVFFGRTDNGEHDASGD